MDRFEENPSNLRADVDLPSDFPLLCDCSSWTSLGSFMSIFCCSSVEFCKCVSSSGSRSAIVTPLLAAFDSRCLMLISGKPAERKASAAASSLEPSRRSLSESKC